MATTIDAGECDVQDAFDQALAIARGATFRPPHEVEPSLWTALLALGRAMVELYLARVVARPWPTRYVHDGIAFELVGAASTEVGTRFGKIEFARPVGRRVGWRRAACDWPRDRPLGLCGAFSLPTVLSVVRLCAQLAFGNARTTFAQFCEWAPSQRSTLRKVDAVGAQARSFLEAAPPPDGDGEILVIQVDGAVHRTSTAPSCCCDNDHTVVTTEPDAIAADIADERACDRAAARATRPRTPRSRSSA